MQVYFPNFTTKQGAIGLFDYLAASRDSRDVKNVIFNSDLNLEDLSHLPGGTGPIDKYNANNDDCAYSFIGHIIANFNHHNSQLFQDLYVLWKLKNKVQGTFVEVGTAEPTWNNNTWILESQHEWSGVLIEPNPRFHKNIKNARTMPLEICAIHHVTDSTLVLEMPNDIPAAAGLQENKELKVGSRVNYVAEITVPTISLANCLQKYNIQKDYDYLSYDTTGNQADIQNLKDMLDNGYYPRVITVGHNYKSHRQDLYSMLQLYGYKREFDYLSKWDDWYYHISLEENK